MVFFYTAATNIIQGYAVRLRSNGQIVNTSFDTTLPIIGIAQQSGTTGSTIQVSVENGISDVHTGLIPGSNYFANSTGLITLTGTTYVGTAISTTQINVSFNRISLPITNWILSSSYRQNDLVVYLNDIYQANNNIPANTPFSIGTTGATWKQLSTSETISYISTGQQAGIILVANNKIYAIKSNNGGNDFYAGANWPNAFTEGSRNGVENMIEIAIPGETGVLVDCKANGPGAYALFSNGNLYTWGYNEQGWCGVGNASNVFYPVLASSGVTEVYTHPSNNSGEAFYARLVIKRTDGKIYGTGWNQNYELGLGDTINRTSFTELSWAGTNPISVWNVGAWGGAIIVQKTDGSLIMSGLNNNGQLGLNTTTTPTFATSASSNVWLNSDTTYRIEEILLNGRYFNGGWQQNINSMTILFRNSSGTRLVTSGNNTFGRIGDGTTTQKLVPTVPTGTWNTIRQITTKGGGEGDTYVLKEDGTLWGWGRNQQGSLGIGNQNQQNSPVQINSGVTRILQGMPSTYTFSYQMVSPLIEKSDGYYSTGYNGSAENGSGSVSNPILTWARLRIPTSTRITQLGETSTVNQAMTRFAVTDTNEIWAWGYNGHGMIEPTGANAWQPLKYKPSILM
jgi:alpha-tubulin suppressor-like RCC1 family protein